MSFNLTPSTGNGGASRLRATESSGASSTSGGRRGGGGGGGSEDYRQMYDTCSDILNSFQKHVNNRNS